MQSSIPTTLNASAAPLNMPTPTLAQIWFRYPAWGPDTAIQLQEKIDKGELIVIVGDRTPPAENGRIVEAEFLGRKASFAMGPWILASLLGCPVYLFFCLPQDDGYCIHFEPFAERIELPRKNRQAALESYAATLRQPPRRLLRHGSTTMVQFL